MHNKDFTTEFKFKEIISLFVNRYKVTSVKPLYVNIKYHASFTCVQVLHIYIRKKSLLAKPLHYKFSPFLKSTCQTV